jgi:hypothetical protein
MPSPWLTHDALLRAWDHVRENDGCAGADGISIDRFARDIEDELTTLRSQVEHGHYRALPLLPITVQKKPGSPATRTLLVWCVIQMATYPELGEHEPLC